jgi:betaine-aldehyde dehydrogenase
MSDEAARRRQLIEATIETLAEVGFNAASLSEIARRAKVSVGLFAHYFGDKDGLLEATLRFTAARLARSTASGLRAATTRRERVFAVCEAALSDEEFDRPTGAVWLAFWGQMAHSDRYRRVQGIYERRMISNLRHALRGLVPEDRVGLCAVLIAAGIDGLWLRSQAAGPHDAANLADSGSARALVRALVESLLASAALGASAGPLFSNTLPLSSREPGSPCSSNNESKTFRVFRSGAFQVPHLGRGAARGLADWGTLAPPDRARILHRCADALRAEEQALARLETLETGRPIRATAADLSEAIVGFDEAAGLARGMGKVRIELEGGRIEERRHAGGRLIMGAIHWSRPLLELGALARAMARGDALLLRPDPHAARTIAKVIGALVSAGMPEGVVTLASGEARQDPLSDQIARRREETTRTRIPGDDDAARFGHAGPKAATVILPGADLEKASRSALLGSRAWTGSTFASQSRIYVHQSIHRRFAEACAAAAGALRLGDPLAQETEVGPLLSREHGQWIEDLLGTDLRAGASLVAGGKSLFISPSEPLFLAPTVIDGCGPASALARADTFAPIVALQPFDNDDEVAIALSKDSPAEALGVFAGDLDRAAHLVAACDRPLSFVNDGGLGESEGVWWRRASVAADPPPLRQTVIAGPPGGS